ncbi:hypothetical protein BD626DRAFT_565929 [Schizophyllum amplum]|uniref:Uncharacterized protein n=1 Tax=Schizophyllum amplum TaxID=97359 RepID=A0A550CQ08_9AGAR|nr:hypothetical protein BD626DRAFT_565929 [Auriculariopsis ampla]
MSFRRASPDTVHVGRNTRSRTKALKIDQQCRETDVTLDALLDLLGTLEGQHVYKDAREARHLDYEAHDPLALSKEVLAEERMHVSSCLRTMRETAGITQTFDNYSDLEPFSGPQPPFATVSFDETTTLDQIIDYYGHNGAPRTNYALRALALVAQSSEPIFAACQWMISSSKHPLETRCNEMIATHMVDTIWTHTVSSDNKCGWHGCGYEISPYMHTRRKGLLALHVAVQHFHAIPTCPLCECTLYRPPNMPASDAVYKLETHFASGWCIGLARWAIALGRPVIAPAH